MSEPVLQATLAMRAFLFDAVYENETATAEFTKATGILGGLWEKVRERPDELLDRRIVESEGLDVAARDFLAGMTDRFAVSLVRAAVHPEALDRSDGLESAIIEACLSHDFRARGLAPTSTDHSMQLDLTRYRQPVSSFARTFQPAEVAQEGDAYRIVAPVDVAFEIHKDKEKFRLEGRGRTELELTCSRCLEPYRVADRRGVRPALSAGEGDGDRAGA